MKLSFLGAAHEVTGSCTLLETGNYKILIDCGMEQGADTYENCELPVLPAEIDCILLTHAHIDHSGKIPMLTAAGFTGSIYCTGATRVLSEMMLKDSAHIQEAEMEWKNRKSQRSGGTAYVPLYTLRDVEKTLPLFVPCEYEKNYQILENIKIRFMDAGHLLGSASIEVTVTEGDTTKVILFSGDVGNIDRPLIKDPVKPEHADIVIVESTYGNRYHGERADYVTQLTKLIQETLDRGGNLVIPAFAVGRTQEMLYLIRDIKERHLVKGHPEFPVWVDSPMAVEATEIYAGNILGYYDEEAMDSIRKGIDVLNFKGLYKSVTSADSIALNKDDKPKVIISASGMCEAGRIRHHLKHNLWKKESTILFVGYQSAGTLGNKLLNGADKVKLFGEEIQVNAHIEKMDGISGHADLGILLDWLGNLKEKPEQVFVNHGDDQVCEEFAETVRKRLGFSATAPYNGAVYDLLTGTCLEEGNKIRISKPESGQKSKGAAIYENLLRAGRRLMTLLEKCRGYTNKDMKKLTSEIDALCEKWEK